MKQVVIVSATRTAIGGFGGGLSSFSATQLGGMVIKEVLAKAAIKAEQVNEVLMGNVLSANLGQAPATQAAKFAGMPDVNNTTINKVCASGTKAVMLGAQSIQLGVNEIVVAGGMESMSNVPFYLEKARQGYKLGHQQVTDGIIKDGLWDVYNDYHMGSAGELCATACNISRADQDEFAIESYKRAITANEKGNFAEEIVGVEIKARNGDITIFKEDEEFKTVKFDKIPTLKPVFKKDGTITAANASTLNDGASALLLMSEEKAKSLGLKPLAKIIGFADAQQAPEWFTTAPSKAIPLALQNAGITLDQVDFFEINEAFAVVSLANNRALKLDPSKVNVNGGAISLGHPLGSSGCRIIVTLLSVLKQNNGKYGVAAICNGGGGASAIVIERV